LDTATQLAPQNNQLMPKHRVLSFKPDLRLEGRGHDGQNETEQPDHSASLSDSITSSTRTRFPVHTTVRPTPTTVDRVTMVDGTTDGIVTTGEIQREELWFDKLDLTATCPPVPFLESPRQP